MRMLGWVLVALGFGLGFAYGFGQPLGAVIYEWSSGLIPLVQAGVQRNLAPWLWDDVILPVLERPIWVGPVVLGCLVFFLRGMFRRVAGRAPGA